MDPIVIFCKNIDYAMIALTQKNYSLNNYMVVFVHADAED